MYIYFEIQNKYKIIKIHILHFISCL